MTKGPASWSILWIEPKEMWYLCAYSCVEALCKWDIENRGHEEAIFSFAFWEQWLRRRGNSFELINHRGWRQSGTVLEIELNLNSRTDEREKKKKATIDNQKRDKIDRIFIIFYNFF